MKKKIMRKLIILLIMMLGILTIGTSRVNAASLPTTNNGTYVSTSYKKLKVGSDYFVTFPQYERLKNLFCAEKGQRLWSVGRNYKVIAHIKIKNSDSWKIDENGKKVNSNPKSTANKKFSKDYNKKLATGIATLSGDKQKYFIWGYMKTWIKWASDNYKGIPSNFATAFQPDKYDDILEKVEDDMLENAELAQDKLEDATDYGNINYITVKIGNTEYERVGPFKLRGVPSSGLKSMEINDQDGREISSAKIAHYSDGEIKAIKASQIKSNKNFYICIPKGVDVTKIKATAKTEKWESTDGGGVEADIYLLQCYTASWQNLVVTDGETSETLSTLVDVSLNLHTVPMPGDLTILKQGDRRALPGATFAIFKYVKNDKGTWYQKGDTYTQNANEATDKSTKYKRAYLCSQGANRPYLYNQVGMDSTVKGDSNYHFTTGLDGKISLSDLAPGDYFATELQAPEGFKKIDGFFKLGEVKTSETLIKMVNNQPDTTNLDLTKVDANNQEVVLEGVGFKFKHPSKGWLKKDKDAQGDAEYTNNESEAKTWTTDANGKIHLEGIEVGNWEYKEDPETVPYGYTIGKGTGTFQLKSVDTNTVTVTNKQEFVKLSGFVWVDKVGVKSGDGKDRNDLFKATQTGAPDERDLLFDGITVKLKDRTNGSTVKETVTSNLGRYTDYGHNGHGEYLFEDVKIDELDKYYIEFTYDGLNYTNVVPHIEQSNGSKAAESEKDRTDFNNKFSVIEGRTKDTGAAIGTDGKETALKYTIDEKERTAILNNDGEYTETDSYMKQDKLGDFVITANTNVPNYSIKANFTAGQEEIKYINLGLKDRDRPDISLGKNLQNIKISVNGYNHVYDYTQVFTRIPDKEGEESFNVGVRYKNNYTGTYKRAIYQADYEYETEDKSKELQVYITYRLSMAQSNINLKAKVNSVTDYFDGRYTLERIGTGLNDDKSVGGTIIAERKDGTLTGKITDKDITDYGDGKKYKKVTMPCDLELKEAQKDHDVYVQFKLSREQVKEILRDKGVENKNELLNNVAEINSYSIFDENGAAYAGVDKDSNPGNCDIENENTYEDDANKSPGIQLEVADARVMTGKVFIDNHVIKGKEDPNGVMTGMIRQGNGKYDAGEADVSGVEVTLTENTGSGKVYTAKTGSDGNFEIKGYIPGDYTVTYTWGGQKYMLNGKEEEITVQHYKGTIYDKTRDQNNKKWWYVKTTDPKTGAKEPSERLTDAIDNYDKDQEVPKGSRIQIDEELKNLNKDTMNNITRKQMDSTTPTMGIGVEYEEIYSASTGDRYTYSIDNIDFGIIERPKQDILLTKRVKTMKVTLANGQVIANLTVNEKGEIEGEKNGVTYMKPSPTSNPSNGFIRLELDNELIQGTKLEVEYEIVVKNNSEKDYVSKEFYLYGQETGAPVTITPAGIIDYLDKNWSFDNNNGENTKWKVMKVDDDFKKFVVEDVYDSSKATTETKTTIGQKMILYTDQLSKTNLEAGQSATPITFNVSKILTTTDEIALNNEVEQVTATKTGGAMIQTTLGNYIPGAGPTESDDSMAETAIVTPATGDNRAYIVPIIIGTTALIILGAGVIIIKKKVI